MSLDDDRIVRLEVGAERSGRPSKRFCALDRIADKGEGLASELRLASKDASTDVISIQLYGPAPLGLQIGEISQCDGTVVLGVAPNSHAERAGLRCGDILCYPSTDGTVPLPFSALGSATSKEPGMPLSMDVIRRQRPERTSWFNGRSRVSVSKIL
mmetsp:Transcript_9581/g.28744  ORF Transcript_9581/g.28744 Transcript_9581/m.28744 type:complete len:156 (-) Transcript_9581:296-763(-)|eukprot:CAMPEP_0113526476 /NCGR_PEP_ID=MMETSP0015_2-20120614/762_1 /TAXON_ID=2838 /ORGANISM="Odontella" /LENGTH=155 /DNA_ID=CAMNT_0000424805 /DNA_START=195 /DNA_END=662 /DNA_ORIENTATION=+ /assembly_acc=CAM_ASM_000160